MNRNAMRFPGLMRMGLIALALGPFDQANDYEAIRQRRLAKLRADLRAEGMSEEEATAEVERLDRAAMDIAEGFPCDWGWAFDQVIKDRTEAARFTAVSAAAHATIGDLLCGQVEHFDSQRDRTIADGLDGHDRLSQALDAAAERMGLRRQKDSGVTVDLDKIPDPSRATVEEIAAAADPPGALTVTADGRLVWRGFLEAIDRPTTIGQITVGGATMVEVNRRRREAGELGTKRQRSEARKGRR